MSHIVTASYSPKTNLRIEMVKTKREIEVPSGFSTKDGKVLYFKDEHGKEISLSIKDISTFDLDNEVQRHNWNVLKIFCLLNKDIGKDILLVDAEEENAKAVEFSDLVFKVEEFVRSKKEDYLLLQKLYRRVTGRLVDGANEVAIYRTLIDHAKTTPSDFFINGQMINAYADFEFLALVDVAVERGYLIVDHDKTVKKHDGSIYAKDVETAAFQLKSDDATRIWLERAVQGKLDKTTKKREFSEEESELVVLLGKVGLDAGQGLLNLDNNKSDDDAQDSLDEIEVAIPSFVSAGLVEKTGVAAQTRYLLPDISDYKYTKKELAAYFSKNYAQYKSFKETLAV